MKIFYSIANLFHIWLTRRHNTGMSLIKYGAVIVSLSFGAPAFYFVLKISSGDEIELRLPESSVDTLSLYAFVIGAFLILVGVCLILYEKFKGEAAPCNRAKSIDLRSLKNAYAPKLSEAFPSIIDQTSLYDDLYLEDYVYDRNGVREPSEFLPITTSKISEFSTGLLKATRDKEPLKHLALGAIAHVPYCFALGFLIGNKSNVNYYCWKRDQENSKKTKWIDCRDKIDLGQSANFITVVNNSLKDTDVKHLGMSIELSIKSDEQSFVHQNQLDACCKVTLPDQSIGNVFSDVEQIRIVSQIINYFNNELSKRFINITELHITISAQASFVMRLGAELDQNHMPEIKIYHFEKGCYPWHLILNNGSNIVGWGQVAT